MRKNLELVIANEDDAWNALDRATKGDFPNDLKLIFNEWPSFHIDIKGKDWDSTVPSRVMSPLLDIQRDINRAYTSVRYNEFNLRKLKDEERDELEVILKVEKGSSSFDAELWKQFNHIAEAAISRMDGNQIVIVVLGIALAYAAPAMFKIWLQSRQNEKELTSRIELSKQETERLKIFSEAINRNPALSTISEDAQATNNRLLKAIKPGDQVTLKGVELNSDEVEVIVQPERERAQDVFLDGTFIVLGNRTDKGDGFRITVKRVSDELILNADVPLELEHDQIKLIQDAEWKKGKINLSITASMLRDSFTHAVVSGAKEVKEE
ncbi:hypothetical protein [Nitrosomonas sp.]|uniref:hypothetical protein n=1 Tax=Nitrosomonas sp. TaxID=42353 RepID=UPI0025CFBF24|nr:hypothetical protein [Nitrosomonas sp.]